MVDVGDLCRARDPCDPCGLCSCGVQSKGSEYCAPLTSFDWNQTDPSMIITSSIDTTCALWDLEVREQEHPQTHARPHPLHVYLFHGLEYINTRTHARTRTHSVRCGAWTNAPVRSVLIP